MIEIFLLILLFASVAVNVFLLITLKKLFNQVDILEDWIINFKKSVENTFNKLKDIDDRGIFEKDDDVGFLFSDLKQIIESLNKKVKEEETDNV
jgi:uncharacterized UPF0160 family protein